jgi:hypothetical protein
MGFMDGFTSDGIVEVKHTEYYALMREAAKAELLMNATRAGVPSNYIEAMATGKMPKEVILDEAQVLEAKTMDCLMSIAPELNCCMWGRLAAAVKDIFNDTQDNEEAREMKEAMAELLDTMESSRRREIWVQKRAEECAREAQTAAESEESENVNV